ncbi:Ubiquitin carboxyl-terminal hydrolase [Gracilaria domingensis]|nr:Ubiquitin carboxyl-terminal hydrolase [Gracilaria domingensis]
MTRAQVFGCNFGRAGGTAVAWQREMNADVHRLFGGVLQSCVQCTDCDFKSITTEPFLDMSLEISRVSSVERALDRFCAVETLHGDNRYRCEGCRSLVDAHKRFSVRRAPNVLTLHLKRFDRTRKDSRFISFPETLDLAPYMYGRPNEATAKYKLSALLIHQGTSRQFGHYYAYVRSANGTWCLKDDSTSRTTDLSTVMKQKAYLLFYTRIEDSALPKGKKSSQNPISVARRAVVNNPSQSAAESVIDRRKTTDFAPRNSSNAARPAWKSRFGTTQTKPQSPRSPKHVSQQNGFQTLRGSNKDEEIELSEESSDEEEIIMRKRTKSHMTNKTQSSENSDDRSSRKSDGPKQIRAAVTENAKRILRSPVKALASLTGSRRLSDDKSGKSEKSEETGMRRLLGSGRRRSESTMKSGEPMTPNGGKVEKTAKSSSLVEPVSKAFSSRKTSVLSYKRFEDRPKKGSPVQAGADRKPSTSPSRAPSSNRSSPQKKFERRVASSVEGLVGKKKSPSDGKEPKRFFSTLRRESKLAAKQEAKANQGSDEDTIPSDPTSSVEDEDNRVSDVSPTRGKESQSSLQGTPRRTSSQEVLIAGGSKVQTVMRRVFGLSPLASRAEKKKGAGVQSAGQSRQSLEGRKGIPKSDVSKDAESSIGRAEPRGKLQFKTSAAASTTERAHAPSSQPKVGNSAIFSSEGVDTWEGANASAQEGNGDDSVRSFARSKIVKRRRANDSLDAEYDRGKQKKARQKFSPVSHGKGRNVFDAFVERKR